jgi:hypothetical protein
VFTRLIVDIFKLDFIVDVIDRNKIHALDIVRIFEGIVNRILGANVRVSPSATPTTSPRSISATQDNALRKIPQRATLRKRAALKGGRKPSQEFR